MIRYLNSVEETERFGAELCSILPAQCIIFLTGPLGAGKTAVVRGFLRAAGFNGAVKSPTFTLVEEYQIDQQKILHFDLYRLSDPEELEWIGIRDYLTQSCISFIEWPEKGEGFLPLPDKEITLAIEGLGRTLTIK